MLRLTRFEWVLWDKGILHVAGVDEAGLSPLAGPASAAASFPVRVFPALMIQKKLNAAERERLAAEIKRTAVAWSVGFADVSEKLAVKRALEGLLVRPGHVLVDGRRIQDMKIAQQPIIKGDAKSLTIAAASILAKTARDALMYNLDAKHPGYGFAKHKGYPVPEHLAALKALGACSIHRTSFGPVRSILGLPPLPPWPGRAVEIAVSAGGSRMANPGQENC